MKEEYDHIKSQLREFLTSTSPHVEAKSVLSQNLHAYIFGSFRINPYDKQNQMQVIREALKDMVIVPSGILRLHVSTFQGPQFEPPIKQGNLLWYRVNHNTKYDFKIINMFDAIAGLDLTMQEAHKRDRKPNITHTKMDISDNDAQDVSEVRLDPENLHLFTFTKDGHTVLRVLFTAPGVDFPFPPWCDIQHPITEDESISQDASISEVAHHDGTHTFPPIIQDTNAKTRILQLLKELESLIQSNVP